MPRSDKGCFRKMEPAAVQEAVDQARAYLRPGFRISQLYRMCIEKGFLERKRIAPNTLRRMVKRYEFLKPETTTESKERLAFAKRYANEMWQADTLVGPFVRDPNGEPRQSRLIAFLDDASRVCCHGQFFFEETHATLKTALRAALFKRGLPIALYVDNGSIYAGKDLSIICGRLAYAVGSHLRSEHGKQALFPTVSVWSKTRRQKNPEHLRCRWIVSVISGTS